MGTAPAARAIPACGCDWPRPLCNYSEDRLVVDGRFTGGFITRQYGDPDNRIHSFQLELSMAPIAGSCRRGIMRRTKAAEVRPALRAMLEAALTWAREQSQ